MDRTNSNLAFCSAMAEELSRCGVQLAVISPGSRSTPLALAFEREPGIETFVGVDERACSFLALGAAQASSTPVVLICTSGTASANYHPAVAEADLSAVPLILLTADRPPELRDVGAGQAIDQIKMFGDAVRLFVEVGDHRADDPGLIHSRSLACRAFSASAGDPRPGPVQLNLGLREPLAPVPDPASVVATSTLALEGRGDRPLTEVISKPADPADLDIQRVSSLLQGRDRVMIVAGRQLDPGVAEPASRLAERLGAPLLAEPTSQLRSGPHDTGRVVWRYDAILGSDEVQELLIPEAVIRIGEMPTSKALRKMLSEAPDCVQIVVDPSGGWHEPSRIADLILRSDTGSTLERFAATLPAAPDDAFARQWLTAQDGTIGADRGDERLDRAAIHRAIHRTAKDGEIIYTASSLAIRDQEAEAPPGPQALTYLANRGANGIDGLVSSGIGAALATGRRTTAVTGDVGFRHDVGALDLLAGLDLDIRIVVVNDGGGRIFERLPQKDSMSPEEFDRLMLTPGSVEPSVLAATWGIPATRVDDIDALVEALEHPGPLVVEVCPDH
jgi:2-succinyl-5-enolpyruvyl-6-hydroxy-3-cyclohexene-1-carboxylate synthase